MVEDESDESEAEGPLSLQDVLDELPDPIATSTQKPPRPRGPYRKVPITGKVEKY